MDGTGRCDTLSTCSCGVGRAARVGGRLRPDYSAALSAICLLGVFFVLWPVLSGFLGEQMWPIAVEQMPVLRALPVKETNLPIAVMVPGGLLALGAGFGMAWLRWRRPKGEEE